MNRLSVTDWAIALGPIVLVLAVLAKHRWRLRQERRANAEKLEAYHRLQNVAEIRRGASGHPAFHNRRVSDRVRH